MKHRKNYTKEILIGGFGAVCQIFRAFLGFITLLLMIGAIAGLILYIRVRPEFESCREKAYDTLATMKDSDFAMRSDTEIYDKDGIRIGTINAGHYEYVPITDISMNIQNAYIAQEDRRFKIHNGIDYTSILRAGLALVKHNGKITQGGSTITQQVIKNVYLTQEKSFTRKITEILLAPELEKKYSKADIMEFYCNGNYYGNRCYGVESASKFYFGKSAKDLNVWESATLAGISNSPTAYDPIKNPEASLVKRNDVLKSMHEIHYLDDETYAQAIAKPLSASENYSEGTSENYQTSYAIHCAALELMKKENFEFKYVYTDKNDYNRYKEQYNSLYSEKSELIRSGGFRIYTSLDSDIQKQLQENVDKGLDRFTELQDNGKFAMQGSAVCVDNRTDYVVAIVGGRGADDEFNRGYLSSRQPGSTIKPLIDYAPAFETGQYYPTRFVNDYKFEDGPNNSGGSYYGNVTIREALNRSLNTVAWQVLQDIGVDTGMEYLAKLHFMNLSYLDNGNYSMSIGGFTNGARTVDMAKGYSTLANGGEYSEKTCITSMIEQHDGELYSKEQQRTQVYSSDTAYMITDILKGTFTAEYGTARGLGLSVPCAGKTGTTNNSKDTWFCGYTRQYTTAVWVGYDTPRAMPGVYGSTYAGKIWKHFMQDLHQGMNPEDWEKPSTVEMCNVGGDGVKTNEETGWVDLFSINTDVLAAQNLHDRQQEKLEDSVAKELEEYLDFQISTVEDAYREPELYEHLKEQIDLIEEYEVRKENLVRLEDKHSDCSNIIADWKDAIEEYEVKIESEKEQARKQAEQEAEKQRFVEEHDTRIANFDAAVSKIEDLEYQSNEIRILVEDALNILKKCVSYEEYNAMRERLSSAVRAYPSKMTKEQWAKSETDRIAREAAERQQEFLTGKQLEQSVESEVNAVTGVGPSYETESDVTN